MKIFYEYLAVEADGAAILARHGWPMIVVRSRKKQEYLEALHQSDLVVGMTPSEGSHASLVEIRHFLHYFQRLVQTEIQSDIDFVQAEGEEFWWYDGERIQFRSPNANKVLLHYLSPTLLLFGYCQG